MFVKRLGIVNQLNKPSYDDGYRAGKNWCFDYIPGDPYSCDDKTISENKTWHEGFLDGMKARKYKTTDHPMIHDSSI